MNVAVKIYSITFLTLLLLFIACGNTATAPTKVIELTHEDPDILTHIIDPKKGKLAFYLNDDKGEKIGNHGQLKDQLNAQNKKLVFAVNGGMYNKDQSPQGLYIESGAQLQSIDRKAEGYGNFYLQPNGIFYLDTKKNGHVVPTTQFQHWNQVDFATQSGPMLVIDGQLHPKFNDGSPNVHIRNGVGVLPNGQLLFAMSKEKINFYSFAKFFQQNGCKNALYLDGFVSRTYLPSKKWVQEDGKFGVIIGEVE